MSTGNIPEAPTKIIRLPTVLARVGLKKTAIYERIKDGDFPKPIKLGRASGWVESEIQGWIDQHIFEQREAA